MKTVRLTMAQALVAVPDRPEDRDRRPARCRCSPASSRSSATATSPASARRWRRCRTSCRPGAARTSSRWRWPRSASPRRSGAARSWSRPARSGRARTNMVTAAGVAHANRLPVLLLVRRHLRQPPARSGAAAGRALRRPDHHRQRRLQAGDPLLGPHHPARADHALAAAGGRDDARPGRLRPGLHRPAARTCRPRPSTIPTAFFEPRVHRIRARGPTRASSPPRPRRCCAGRRSR